MSPRRRPKTSAQQTWDKDPVVVARVGLVWELYLKRVSYLEIRRRVGAIIDQEGKAVYGTPSYSTVKEDVRRARRTLHKEHAEFVKEQTEELVALRNLIVGKTLKAFEDLEALQNAEFLKGHTKEGEPIYVTESPVAVARAKADLARALSTTVSDLERLLGLRSESGGDVNIDKVQILRIEGPRAVLALPEGEDGSD